MYAVSLIENRVLDVYDTEIYLDEGVDIFPISNDEFERIKTSGNHANWIYENGNLVFDEWIPLVKAQAQFTGVQEF